jgi:hypothetical protein
MMQVRDRRNIVQNAEFERINTVLDNARIPEDVFGPASGTQATTKSIFRQMAKTVHPDAYQRTADFARASAAFKRLAQFWALAQTKLEDGTYGIADMDSAIEPFIIHTRGLEYTVERLLTKGDLCSLYIGTSLFAGKKVPEIIKIPIQPADNDLVANEARILIRLQKGADYEQLKHFVSQLVDTFSYREEASGIIRNINVLSYATGFYSLKEVRDVYTQGLDPKDMAWIWRRLLIALGFAHHNGIIHGAVLPTHILLQPEQHGVMLIDWSYAVLNPGTTGEHISALSSAYRDWYPGEVFAKAIPTPGLDIMMAARCMVDLLGGDPQKQTMPATIPWQIQSHLKGCMLPQPQQRPQDAMVLLQEFDDLIERLWGPRRFRKFMMPKS